MMASTGNMAVGQPSPDAMRELAGRPPAVTRDEVVQQMLQAFRVIGSPGYPMDEDEVAARVGRAYDRSSIRSATRVRRSRLWPQAIGPNCCGGSRCRHS